MLNVNKGVPATFAVTLADAKLWMALNNTGYDSLIEDTLIPAAQDLIERATGVCLSEAEITVNWSDFTGVEPLPYAPFIATDATDVAINGSTVTGASGEYELIYTAGYETSAEVPKGLIVALMNLINYLFDNRGDMSIPRNILTVLHPYKRNLML